MKSLKKLLRFARVPVWSKGIASARLGTSARPVEIRKDALHESNALAISEAFLKTIPASPDNYTGRGIVICGGGIRLFTSAWVCINMLRKLGCALPIQLWHLGDKEMDARMKAIVQPLHVECVDALELRKTFSARILNGWELKAYSLLNSPFKEVLLLDADNVPAVNPEFLFETNQYKETGAIFWPDLGRLQKGRLIWKLCGVHYRDEPEFESGQLLVNKEKTGKALRLALWYNEHSDFYYKHIHGDKETFHLAFRKMEIPYAMPAQPVLLKAGTMYQHDFEGNVLFQHRNGPKWNYHSENPRLPGFRFEEECFAFIRDLKLQWNGTIAQDFSGKPHTLGHTAKTLITQTYNYHRIGYDKRPLTFLSNGKIGAGNAGCEQFWNLQENADKSILEIRSENALTCALQFDADNVWRGRWLIGEKMPVELLRTDG